LAKIKDDDKLVEEINDHFPLVSRNLLKIIVDEERSDKVWLAMVKKLSKSPADLRETLIFLARRGAFRHTAFVEGYKALAVKSQHDFGNFMSELYSCNKYEFKYIYDQGLLEYSPFTKNSKFSSVN
jgi:hypothetical protein